MLLSSESAQALLFWNLPASRENHALYSSTGSDVTKRGHTDREPYIWCSSGERFVADLLSCIGGDHATERTFEWIMIPRIW